MFSPPSLLSLSLPLSRLHESNLNPRKRSSLGIIMIPERMAWKKSWQNIDCRLENSLSKQFYDLPSPFLSTRGRTDGQDPLWLPISTNCQINSCPCTSAIINRKFFLRLISLSKHVRVYSAIFEFIPWSRRNWLNI